MSLKRLTLRRSLSEDLYACAQCGYCTVDCPINEVLGWESYTPRGKIFLFKKIAKPERIMPVERGGSEVTFTIKSRDELVREVVKRVYTCTTCGRCSAICGDCIKFCHIELNPLELWLKLREAAYNSGIAPEILYKVEETITSSKNIYGMDNETRRDWAVYTGSELKVKDRAKVVYFVGCITSYSGRVQGVAQAITSILDYVGEDWTVLEDEGCCGHPLYVSGATKRYREVAKENVKKIMKVGAEIVVTGCPGCYLALKEEYPHILGLKPPFEVLHFTELLRRYVIEGRVKLEASDRILTYHDPCELGRIGGVLKEPRQLINELGKLVEPKHSYVESKCCGAGGMLKAVNPELSQLIATSRLKTLVEVSPETILTACPSCELNLKEAALKSNFRIEILDIAEIVARELGLYY